MDLFVRFLVAAGATTVLATEILGAGHAIGRVPLALLWIGAAVLAGRQLQRRVAIARPGWLEVAVLTAVAAILALTAWTALASPPNSVDAFGYHLSRVVWWAQQRSVEFFPTHYFPQISMPPMAEYAMLHTWVLTGGDRFVNLVQWIAFAGSIATAALVAREFGAARRGQAIAALFCATLPNAILQASGAKNDCVLALWLAATAYFALRWRARPTPRAAVWLGLALALALATKATAWLFLPPLLLCLRPRAALIPVICVLALNGPLWWRNLSTFGAPLGPATAQASQDPHYRWTVERPGLRPTFSNALRHFSQQLGSRSERASRAIYAAALHAHAALSIDPNDPATTWPGARFEPPRNANHEADAPNRVHLLLLCLGLPFLIRRRGLTLAWAVALAAAFLLACASLKYQPYFSRVFLPLFVLAAPLAGVLAERLLRPAWLQAALCLLLFDQARHPLLHNWTRPLIGPNSILATTRDANYFRDMGQFHTGLEDYRRAAQLLTAPPCATVGIDNERFHLEYPLQVFLLRQDPATRFVHTQVPNAPPQPTPCAIACLGCAADPGKQAAYAAFGPATAVGPHLVYRFGGRITAATTAPASASTASFP